MDIFPNINSVTGETTIDVIQNLPIRVIIHTPWNWGEQIYNYRW